MRTRTEAVAKNPAITAAEKTLSSVALILFTPYPEGDPPCAGPTPYPEGDPPCAGPTRAPPRALLSAKGDRA
jgi:hypothetical protein